MNFKVIDVETANSDYSSICQIGLISVENGIVKDEWETLINPESYFDPFNVSIHGIDEVQVKDSPTFDKIYEELNSKINGELVIHHGHFDRVALNRVCYEYALPSIPAIWLDSTKIVRRTWEQFSKRGYGLKNIAEYLGIEFNHHNALEDSRATYKVVLKACNEIGVDIEYWLERIKKPISVPEIDINRKVLGNPDGSLYGEVIVFTGEMSLSRAEATKIASDNGCTVATSVSKKTTKLVVGIQDDSKLNGYKKSSKHRKAEEMIGKGHEIDILSEKDFMSLCEIDMPAKVEKKALSSNKRSNDKKPITYGLTISSDLIQEVDYTTKKDLTREEKRGIANFIEELITESKIQDIQETNIKVLTISDLISEISEVMYLLNTLKKGRIHIEEFRDDLKIHIASIEDYVEKLTGNDAIHKSLISNLIMKINKAIL